MLLNLLRTVIAQTVSRLTLNHLKKQRFESSKKSKKDTLTLLIKSAASSDQPFGTSLSLI